MAAGTTPVGTRVDLDRETMAPEEYVQGIDNNDAVARRIVGPFAPHETYEGSPPTLGMKVTLDAGYIRNGETVTEVAAQQSSTLVAPVTDPRIDLVYIDRATGVVGVAGGTEDPSPVAPALPAGKAPVALLAMTVGMTEITNVLNITDVRAPWLMEVDTGDLVDGAVTEAKLADGAVTDAKLEDPVVHIDNDGASPPTTPAGRVKFLEIGPWNMETTATLNVPHGLTAAKIRSVAGYVRDDSGTRTLLTATAAASSAIPQVISFWDGTNIGLACNTASFAPGTRDSTAFSRGHLVVTYDADG